MDVLVGTAGSDRSMTMRPGEALPHAYLTLVLATLVALLIPVTALRLVTLLRHADRLDAGKEESA